jgi:hypothetical protein
MQRADFQHVTDSQEGAFGRAWVYDSNRTQVGFESGERLMAKRPPNDGASWSARELKTLKALAKSGTPTGQVAKKLGRTAAAVQQKAMRSGISFRAAKRSGARRKK